MASMNVSPESSSTAVGGDLMSSVSPDLFTSADASDLSGEFSADDGGETFDATPDIEAAPEETPVIEDAPQDAQPEVEELPAEEEPVAAVEELPEGVRKGKDRNGKEGMWLTPQRYEQFHGAYRAARDFEAAIGEPLTPAALDLRHRAFMGQERLYNDLTSGDPSAQGRVLEHFFKEARDAQKSGLVGNNPIVPLAQEFYKQVKTDPDAYASLRMEAARDLINEMYQEAGTKQDMNLWRSAGWVAKNLNLSFKPEAEMVNFAAQQADPLHHANQTIQQLQAQLNGRTTADSTAQFNQWKSNLAKENSKALMDEALVPSISDDQRSAWDKFPAQFQNLVIAPLNRQVREVIAKDAGFQERITLLGRQAQRATSAQARSEIAADMKQLFVNRGRIAADALKNPILKEAGGLLQQQNDKNHQRRAAAQDQRSPQGSRAAVPRSLVPGSVTNNRAGTSFNVNEAVHDLARLFG